VKKRILLATALLVPALAMAQQIWKRKAEKKSKPAAKAAPAKPGGQGRHDRHGQRRGRAAGARRLPHAATAAARRADNEQMRNAVREELINREVIAQEAQRAGMANNAEVKAQLDIVRQEIIVGAYLREYARKHPVSEAEIQKEYDRAKAQHGDKEYKARHILVETEDQAKSLIAELKKGAKFDDLASKNSKDTGSAQRGGDLDWNVPGTFDKMFSDAMVKLEKGQVLRSAGEDALRLPRHPGRRRAPGQVRGARRGQAAHSADAGSEQDR
jgi:parvulin-like peptidyl-prolyl isomerase